MNEIKGKRITEVWMQVIDPRRISKLMVIQGVSQRELAQIIGWKSHSYMGRILRGEIRSIDSEAAVKIAHTFGVGVDDLFLTRASTETVQSDRRRGAAWHR